MTPGRRPAHSGLVIAFDIETCSGDDPPPAVIRYWLAENLRELKRQLNAIDPEFAARGKVAKQEARRWTRQGRQR